MILLDWHGHLVSDTSLGELHEFAQKKLHLKPSWFQDKKRLKSIPHYDLTTQAVKQRAKIAGAKEVTPEEIVRRAVRE